MLLDELHNLLSHQHNCGVVKELVLLKLLSWCYWDRIAAWTESALENAEQCMGVDLLSLSESRELCTCEKSDCAKGFSDCSSN